MSLKFKTSTTSNGATEKFRNIIKRQSTAKHRYGRWKRHMERQFDSTNVELTQMFSSFHKQHAPIYYSQHVFFAWILNLINTKENISIFLIFWKYLKNKSSTTSIILRNFLTHFILKMWHLQLFKCEFQQNTKKREKKQLIGMKWK